MARAETESGAARPGQGRHHSCRMEVPPPYAWAGGSNRPLQTLYQPCPPLHPNMDPPQRSRQALHPPHSPQGEASPSVSAYRPDLPRSERTDSVREHQDTTQRGPRPAPLTQREHPYLASPRDRAPGDGRGGGGNPLQADEDEVLERVANQLKTIGDDLNATLLQRRDGALQWQDWRGLCGRLLAFISDTLSNLYTLR